MQTVLGHNTQRQALAKLASKDALASTLLFCGPEGIGKALVARELASLLLCQQPILKVYQQACGACKHCELILANNHPDLLYLDTQSSSGIDTEQLRNLLRNLSLKAFYGHRRVIILNNVDKLNIQCANLLLKSLEEPKPETYFLLVAANRYSMPSTLVSRCQAWFFDSLNESEVATILTATQDDKTSTTLLKLADGSVGDFQYLQDNLNNFQSYHDLINDILSGDLRAATQLSSELCKDKEALEINFKTVRICVRHLMLAETVPAKKTRLATCLTNLIQAEHYLFQRHLAPLGLLGSIFCSLHCDKHQLAFASQPHNNLLISELVF